MTERVRLADVSVLRARLEQIAEHLLKSTEAQSCVLFCDAIEGQNDDIVAAGMQLPFDDSQLVQIIAAVQPSNAPVLVWQDQQRVGYAAAMKDGALSRGTVLLVFSAQQHVDLEHITSLILLAATALAAAWEVEHLHLQAEQLVEHMRLREIQISRNLIRGVIDSIPDGLALLDSEGIVLAVNRALAARFDREPAGLVGQRYDLAIGVWEESPAAQTFQTGTAQHTRRSMQRARGEQVLLEISALPLFDSAGNPHQVVEVWEDITERVALQTQLVRVEKLAAIGQLAASIAHEVGNPLQAVQGFLALFLEQCPPNVNNQHYLQLAEEEIERIVQVLSRLRDLYRPRADVVKAANLNEIIENVLLLTSKQLEHKRILVQTTLDKRLPVVHVVSDQIKQVLLNLVLNAADAMDKGGTLTLRSSAKLERGAQVVVVSVTDTGVGIAPDLVAHLFDGMHTTKERGMGLGLYTSKAIVEQHMGRITVKSTLRQGTTFTITLPIQKEEVPVAEES